MATFSERIRELRESLNLSQNEFSKRLGVSRVSLTHYEAGDRTPDIDFLSRLHQETGVSIYYLLGLTDSKDDALATAQKKSGLCEDSISILASNPLYQRVIDKIVCFYDFDRLASIAAALHDDIVLRWRNEHFGTAEADDESMYSSLYAGYSNQLEHHLCEYLKSALYPNDDDPPLGAPNSSLPTMITRKTQAALTKASQTNTETRQIVEDVMHMIAGLLDSDYFYDKEATNAQETPES